MTAKKDRLLVIRVVVLSLLFLSTHAFVPIHASSGRLRTSSLLFAESPSPVTPPPPDEKDDVTTTAATGTVNERLLAELQEASNREKYGARSETAKKLGMSPFGSPEKSDAERQQAIEEARNLNGVNPVTAIVGSMVAFAGAAAFWTLTGYLADTFAAHPVPETQVYFVARLTSVFRNVVIGLASLASGFFGVTGLGIFSLGIRVGYGVMKGELDPTPRKEKQTVGEDKLEISSMWDLMTNQSSKRGKR